jgi:uncharacterized protein
MSLAPVPVTAAWHHWGARSGFEVVYFGARGDGCQIEEWTTAIEDSATWVVECCRGRRALGHPQRGDPRTLRSWVLLGPAGGRRSWPWLVDGKPTRRLDGCLDVDLEASAMTNALPVRWLGLLVAAASAAPAAYVRAAGLAVDRLEQTYARATDEAACQRYDYSAPAFGFGPAWSTTNLAWCSTIPGSPCGPADRPG